MDEQEQQQNVARRREELMKLKNSELKDLLEKMQVKKSGDKSTMIERLIHAEGLYIKDRDSHLALLLEKSSNMDLCPNEIYGKNFNFSDVFNRRVFEDVSHDKMNDWRSRYFWNFFQVILRNSYGIFRDGKNMEFWEFSRELAEAMLDYSIEE